MKYHLRPLTAFLAIAVLAGLASPAPGAAEDAARVQVVLVRASDSGEGVDPALKAHAATLQRLFRFKSYQQVSRQVVKLDLPGKAGLSLADGQSLAVSASALERGALAADIEWDRGSTRLLHTRLQLRRGSPSVLGGPRSGDGTWLLILELR